mgnify:CR=1 FL=1
MQAQGEKEKQNKKQEDIIKMKEYLVEKFNSKDGLNYFGDQSSSAQFLSQKLGKKYIKR